MKVHLTQQLETALNPAHLEVINESNHHSGDRSESHFKIIVVSHYFDNLTLLQRHRFINNLFKEELEHIHALAMHTYTPKEWANKPNAPKSPQCSSKSH
jgi:BolA protein